jgi:hypothetical protein
MAKVNFQSQLRRQLGFIERSCVLYDDGRHDEAIRIATSLRVLLHDTRSSTSLLRHLSKQDIRLLSCSHNVPPNRTSPTAVVKWKGTAGRDDLHAVPCLESAPSKRLLQANEWWTETVLYSGSLRMSRGDLILDAANKDGGAHVDSELAPRYAEVTRGLGIGITWQDNDESTNAPIGEPLFSPLRWLHFASLRHFGYEVLNSPDLTELAAYP